MFVTLKSYSDKPVDIVVNTDHVVSVVADGNRVRLSMSNNIGGIVVLGRLEEIKALLNGVIPSDQRQVCDGPKAVVIESRGGNEGPNGRWGNEGPEG